MKYDSIIERLKTEIPTGVDGANLTPNDFKNKLSDLEYKVAFENSTEAPYINEYVNNKDEGIYTSITSGEPVFSSKDKYESGSGWPSFKKPLDDSKLSEKVDSSHNMSRTEVSDGIAHLGHVFPTEEEDEIGLRYCINSASLNFIPKDRLTDDEKKKYGFD